MRDNHEELILKLINKKEECKTYGESKELFKLSKKIINDDISNDIDKAVAFYIVNKCSFSGLTENSSFSFGASNNNFKISIIKNLKHYSEIIKNWRITNLDYTELMKGDGHIFLYLDPPYNITSNIYGKKGDLHRIFNHDDFKKECLKCKCRILISYNLEIDGLDNNYFDLTYTMKSDRNYVENQKEKKEIAITNYYDYYDTAKEILKKKGSGSKMDKIPEITKELEKERTKQRKERGAEDTLEEEKPDTDEEEESGYFRGLET